MSDASSPQPPSVLPPVAADNQEDRHQFPKTVMIALKQQTEFIKSLENSLYLAMRPLTNGRFVLPSLPAQTTEDEDGDETINPVAVLEIIWQQNEAIISLQTSVSKMRPIIINLVASCQNGEQQHINERKSPTNTRRGGAAAASASTIPVVFHKSKRKVEEMKASAKTGGASVTSKSTLRSGKSFSSSSSSNIRTDEGVAYFLDSKKPYSITKKRMKQGHFSARLDGKRHASIPASTGESRARCQYCYYKWGILPDEDAKKQCTWMQRNRKNVRRCLDCNVNLCWLCENEWHGVDMSVV